MATIRALMAVALAAALVTGACRGDATPPAPSASPSAPQPSEVDAPVDPADPAAWHRVEVADATLEVPRVWQRVDVPDGAPFPCGLDRYHADVATLYVFERFDDDGPRDCDDEPRAGSSAPYVLAFPLSTSRFDDLWPDWGPLDHPVTEASWFEIRTVVVTDGNEADGDRVLGGYYAFPSLDLGLIVRADPAPQVVARIIASVAPADGVVLADDPSPTSKPIPGAGLPERLVAAGFEAAVLLGPATGAVLRELPISGGEGAAALSLADDGTLVSSMIWTGCATKLWRLDLAEPGAEPSEVAVGGAFALSPDGTRLAYASGRDGCVAPPHDLVLLDLVTGTEVRRWAARDAEGEDLAVRELDWSADGTRLAVRTQRPTARGIRGLDAWLHVVEVEVGRTAWADAAVHAQPPGVEWRAFTWDGPELLVARAAPGDDDQAVAVFDLATGAQGPILFHVDHDITSIDVDVTGAHVLVTTYEPDRPGSLDDDVLYRWHADTGLVELASRFLSAAW